jgi:hypothetical protein
MTIQPDFEELLRLLEKHEADYMIVGGYAVAFHGYPRFTKDIDIVFDVAQANVCRVRRALCEFGFQESDLTDELLMNPKNVITFGVEPVRVDFVGEIDGVAYEVARSHRVRGRYGKVEVNFIGRLDLIQNKKATKRARDLVDVEELLAGKDSVEAQERLDGYE